MRTGLYGGCIAVGLLALFGCESFNGSGRSMRAVVGGGAVAGRDYVRGLTPSTAAREWFIQNDLDSSTSVMVRRGDDENTTGVRFVANGGIEIPPGAAITYENKGYCLDPHLPAPREGHEFQLVPVSCLIPEGLQGIYDKLVTRAANGDSAVTANMQHLMWALRTAGTDAAYANNLTSEQRRILDSCSEYAGEFEDFCSNERARAQLLGWLIAKVDARLNINIGGVSYKASDLLDPDVGAKKIDAHLQQLIDLGEMVPIEHIGFNYGELEKGIYTDVMGTGPLKFRATVANATSQPFVFYPQRYVGQAGSDVSLSSSAITFSATANDAKVQRVTSGPVDEVGVLGGMVQGDEEKTEEEGDQDCSGWHSRKKRRMEELESIYELALESAARMKFWGGMAVLCRHGSIGIANLLGPEVSVPVASTWLIHDNIVSGDDTSSDVLDIANSSITDEAIEDAIKRYTKAANTKNATTIKRLWYLKNLSKGLTGIGLGQTYFEYGRDMEYLEDKYKSSRTRLMLTMEKVNVLKNAKCPVCGGR